MDGNDLERRRYTEGNSSWPDDRLDDFSPDIAPMHEEPEQLSDQSPDSEAQALQDFIECVDPPDDPDGDRKYDIEYQ